MYANDSIDENPDEISDYFENVIKTGEMKPLSLLEIADKEKYDLVIAEAVPKLQFLEQQPYENRSFAVRTTRPQGEKLQEPVTK
jgi:hypothetical protein